MKYRFSKAIELPSIEINVCPDYYKAISDSLSNIKSGKESSMLLACAEITSHDGIPLNKVLFHVLSKDSHLQIMLEGIMSVVPSDDPIQPLTTRSFEMYFQMTEDFIEDMMNDNRLRLQDTLKHLLVDFYSAAQSDQ